MLGAKPQMFGTVSFLLGEHFIHGLLTEAPDLVKIRLTLVGHLGAARCWEVVKGMSQRHHVSGLAKSSTNDMDTRRA